MSGGVSLRRWHCVADQIPADRTRHGFWRPVLRWGAQMAVWSSHQVGTPPGPPKSTCAPVLRPENASTERRIPGVSGRTAVGPNFVRRDPNGHRRLRVSPHDAVARGNGCRTKCKFVCAFEARALRARRCHRETSQFGNVGEGARHRLRLRSTSTLKPRDATGDSVWSYSGSEPRSTCRVIRRWLFEFPRMPQRR